MKTAKLFIALILLCLCATAYSKDYKKTSTSKRFKLEYSNSNPENKTKGCAYLSDTDPNGCNVREKPSGKVIKVIRTQNEWIIGLREAWNGWFRIDPVIEGADDDNIDLKTDNCWIHGSLLGASTRNYGNQTLKFYTSPDNKSKVVFTVSEEIKVTFVDIKTDWTKVQYKNRKGKKLTGWIETEYLCCNPYTTCP